MMNRKLVFIALLFALLVVAIGLGLRYGEANRKVVTVRMSSAIDKRRILTLTPSFETVLPEAIYRCVIIGDELHALPYEVSTHGYFIFDLRLNQYKQKIAAVMNPVSIGLTTTNQIMIQDKKAGFLKMFDMGVLVDSVPIHRGAWRAVPTSDGILYNAEVPGGSYFFLADLRTGSTIDSFPVARAMDLPNDGDLGMLSTGNYSNWDERHGGYYAVLKAGRLIRFKAGQPLDSLQTLTTIDSLNFPKIVTEEIQPGVTRKGPVPELYINNSVATLNDKVFVVSSIAKDEKMLTRFVDVYDMEPFQYRTSLNLTSGELRPIALFVDDQRRVLWVLYSDNRTLKSFRIDTL